MLMNPCGPARCLSRVMRRSGAYFQAMAIPNGAFARILGQLKILREFEAIGGANVLAQAAEHAARSIVDKSGEHLAAGDFVEIGRASCRERV